MSERTLELRPVADSRTGWHKGKEIPLPAWDVVLDGTVIGRVRKAMITRERRTPGRRYVNARWTSPGWRWYRPGMVSSNGLECSSRLDGVKRLLGSDTLSLSWAETEALVKDMKVTR